MSDVDGATLRETVGHFATGVTVVTVETGDGYHGMTVNSFASVSLDPPLVLFSADRGTNTHDHVAEAEHYAVNVLTADQEWLSNRFAGAHHDLEDPFEDVPTREGTTGAPLIEECLATIDCSLEASYDGGDHTIYVGRVEALSTDQSEAPPLLFYKGAYEGIAPESTP